MDKFIYAFSEADRDDLLAKGASLINTQQVGGKTAYVFENQVNRLFFNEIDKKKFLFTNKVFI